MSYLLVQLDAPMWRAVRELYLQDLVVEALQEAEILGGLDSNDLYAEAEARTKGRQWKLRPWLTLEAIESEVPDIQSLSHLVAAECEDLSKRFLWEHRESTLVTILPHDVEANWMPARWGYFVDKEPYDKICLPQHLLSDSRQLISTVRHEFMHDITLNLSGGRASRWLSEGLSTYAEDLRDPKAVLDYQSGAAEWVNPVELVGLLSTDNRRQEMQTEIRLAYSQSNLIVRYLVSQYGDGELGSLLRILGEESFVASFQTQLLSRSHVDTALRKQLHISELELFAKSHEWVLAQAR